ncbi:NACHT domain-containing protein [Nonomuraea sp. NPDC048882]|uniref:NACHT domain-containing protein n=1 Tax=unclassified Nonomuraea TaxID=2593643 RepID=UPI0033FAD2DC
MSKFGTADDIRALTARFRGLRSRRLIITGGPGTGKTTLALQLLLALLATRGSDEPVPVMLSIAGWDTTRPHRLEEWVAARLATIYPTLRAFEYGGDAAPAMLAAHGHILPILDGLDELPAPARACSAKEAASASPRPQAALANPTKPAALAKK